MRCCTRGEGRLVQGLVRSARSSRLPLLAGSRWYASTEYTSPGSTGFHIPYRTPRRARRKHLVQLVQIVHFSNQNAHLQSREPSLRQASRRGLKQGPNRSGAVDGALPVEIHLSSRGMWGECNQAQRRYEPAHRVRAGSYQRNQVECSFQEVWYELPPKPTARARRGVVPLVLCTPQSRETHPGHTRERGLKSRSEAVRSGVGRFLGLDAPLPRPSPAAHCRDPPQFPGVWGELNPTQRSLQAGLSSRGPGGPASSSLPFGPITIRWTSQPASRSRESPDAAKKGSFWQGLLLL
jgi:hypothetical protein